MSWSFLGCKGGSVGVGYKRWAADHQDQRVCVLYIYGRDDASCLLKPSLKYLNEEGTDMAKEKKVLTTGEVAEICNVATRTVSLWFDKGLLNGYKLPGSKDRRIPVNELFAFMKKHEIPMDGFAAAGLGQPKEVSAAGKAKRSEKKAQPKKKRKK